MRGATATLGASQVLALPCCGDACPRPMSPQSLGWADAAVEQWGACGVVIRRQGRLFGYLLFAPAAATAVGGAASATPVDPDAAVLVKVHVAAEARGTGTGRQLVQAAAAFGVARGIGALEAVGTYGPGSCAVQPVRWLRRAGFAVARNHPLHPLLRLDVASTLPKLRWDVAWDRMAAWWARPGAPESSTSRTRQPSGRRHEEAAAATGRSRPTRPVEVSR